MAQAVHLYRSQGVDLCFVREIDQCVVTPGVIRVLLNIKKYNIKATNILGHSDIAFDRKKDPGEKFPWSYLVKRKIGFWHNIKEEKLIKLRNKKTSRIEVLTFIKYLSN